MNIHCFERANLTEKMVISQNQSGVQKGGAGEEQVQVRFPEQ